MVYYINTNRNEVVVLTLKELAVLAGVSPATISLVLNNKPGVSESKRQEIRELLDKYHYTPARRTQQTLSKNLLFLKYIKNGFLVDENTGFIASIMDSIEVECRKQGYALRIIVSQHNLEETVSSIDFSSICGVFVLGTELDESAYPVLKTIPVPYIVIDNNMPHFSCNAITMNNSEMVYEAVKHLSSLGFHEVGYLRSNMSIQNFEERAHAFYQSIEVFSMHCAKEHEFLLEPTMLGAYASMKQHLQKGISLPHCCFADNDTIAIGAIKALKEFHYKIPEDVCIIGFDDIRFAAVHSPSLSTMRVPKKLIGYLAMKMLTNSMENSECRNSKLQIGGDIVIRHSTLLK